MLGAIADTLKLRTSAAEYRDMDIEPLFGNAFMLDWTDGAVGSYAYWSK
jgi:hypothetical protein